MKDRLTPEQLDLEEHWYKTWFDSPFYPVLYQTHNETEAKGFVDKLMDYLKPEPQSWALDVACGRGRFARMLHEQQLKVYGIDISKQSLTQAKRQSEREIRFVQHDMRRFFKKSFFDYAFNFFTSFGYFKTEDEDKAIIANVFESLKPGGFFVLDYLNTDKATQDLKPNETTVIDQVKFQIKREADQGFIRKYITITHHGQHYDYLERIRKISSHDFVSYFQEAGFEEIKQFGNYQLEPVTADSDRIITIAKRP